jgi:hypothetical protein
MKKIIKNLRSKYSRIDTYIILGVIGLVLGFFGYFMVVEIEGTVKLLGALLGFLYMVFIVSHLFLAFPLFVIAMIVSEFVEENVTLPDSIILLRVVQAICLLVVFFVVYLCVPVLSAMMFNGSFDLSEALDLIHKINHGNK